MATKHNARPAATSSGVDTDTDRINILQHQLSFAILHKLHGRASAKARQGFGSIPSVGHKFGSEPWFSPARHFDKFAQTTLRFSRLNSGPPLKGIFSKADGQRKLFRGGTKDGGDYSGLKQPACGELSHLHRASHCLLFFAAYFVGNTDLQVDARSSNR